MNPSQELVKIQWIDNIIEWDLQTGAAIFKSSPTAAPRKRKRKTL